MKVWLIILKIKRGIYRWWGEEFPFKKGHGQVLYVIFHFLCFYLLVF